jgi:hypothetical protein
MLTITSAYTNAPTIVIAENAAEHDLRRQRKQPCREQHQRLTRSAPPINGIGALFKAHD